MWTTKMLGKTKPKTVFYRALQDNPSAKAFGLDLIHYQEKQKTTASSAAKLIQAEIQDIFTEKEVRIRMPIEELQVLLEPEEEPSQQQQ
jgi:hypothetical protein